MTMRQSVESLVKTALRGMGLELQRLKSANTEEAILTTLLDLVRPDIVLDVGANQGQYAESLRRIRYQGRILSFEALPTIHAKLSEAAAGDPLWEVASCAALGAKEDTLEMNVAGNTASSSLLEMHHTHLDAAPESAFIKTQTVRVMRLDHESVLSRIPTSGSILLKIDTQGYERKVLEGATAILPHVAALQIELSLVELYKGAPSMVEMISYLEHLGFELFNVAPGFKDKRIGRLLQMDGFFTRREPQ